MEETDIKTLDWEQMDIWERKSRLCIYEMGEVMYGINEKAKQRKINDFFWFGKL